MTLSIYLEYFVQLFVTGLLVGCVYWLMCVGLALIFGIMRVINFAQGNFMMIAMYVTLYLVQAIVGVSSTQAFWWTLLAGACAIVLLHACGAATHAALLSRMSGTHASKTEDAGRTPQLQLTLGVSAKLALLSGFLTCRRLQPALKWGLKIENFTDDGTGAHLYDCCSLPRRRTGQADGSTLSVVGTVLKIG